MWTYQGQPFTEEQIENNIGFVYVIQNETNGKLYIGRKLFSKSKSYQKNKKKKKMRVPSDWMTYTGSNDQLNSDIEAGHAITKEILHLCKSKGACSYLETKEIFLRDCLLSESYYNFWVSCKIRRTHVKELCSPA